MKALEIKNLSYTYPSGKTALDGINLSVEQGCRLVLAGSSGCGKSTLLMHITGLLKGSGYIEVSGLSVTARNLNEIRRKTGCLFPGTEYHFIMPRLLEDIMLSLAGPGSGDPETAMWWLKKTGLEQYAECSPLELSSGEMKRAALAGVLAKNPEILLLDEPLNSLDRKSAEDFLSLLSSMPQTMIIATHRLAAAERLATHVAVMEAGRIVNVYSADEGLGNPDVKKYFM